MTGAGPPLLEVRDLAVRFGDGPRPVRAVEGVSFAVRAGEIVGIAGESGSGKSTVCAALVRSLPPTARVGGAVRFEGRDLLALSDRDFRALRGRRIAMVQQNPMTSLDPLFSVGDQMGEVLATHGVARGAAIRPRATDLLAGVRVTAPAERLGQYPHQLSGGIRQRVLIAMATAADPVLLIADEPTSALDATVQEEVLRLFGEIRDRTGGAVVIVSHDLGALRRVCDRTIVMYAGRIVEDGPTATVLDRPRHPYTRGLLACLPRIDEDHVELTAIPGQLPDPRDPPRGCVFAPRCPVAEAACADATPPFVDLGGGHRTACRLETAA